MEDTQKIEAGDAAVVEAEDATDETPEVKVDVPKKDKKPKTAKKKVSKKKVTKKKARPTPKKDKPAKPAPVVGKAKGADKGSAWWKTMGAKLQKREHSERNIILRASRDAGKTFQQAMTAMRMQATLEEKARSLFTD